jgi:hypothetical protein
MGKDSINGYFAKTRLRRRTIRSKIRGRV